MKTDHQNIAATDDGEISLKELVVGFGNWFSYLWRKKIYIIIAGIIGGLLGIGYSYLKKPVYTATTTFVLEAGEKGGASQYAGIASMMGIDLGSGGGGVFQGDNILELYKSRPMIEKTLLTRVNLERDELLIDRYIAFNKLKDSWQKKPNLLNLNFANVNLTDRNVSTSKLNEGVILRDSILGEVVKNISENLLSVAKPDKKLSIIKVDVKAQDNVFAKVFNETLVKNVNDFYVNTKTKKLADNVGILQHKADSVTGVMNGAIYRAVAIADATPNLNPTRQVQRVAPAQKAQFSAEMNKAVLSELVKNLEMSKITLLKETPLIQIIEQPIFPLKKDKLGKAKALIIGGLLFGFLSALLFSLKFMFKNIMSEKI